MIWSDSNGDSDTISSLQIEGLRERTEYIDIFL